MTVFYSENLSSATGILAMVAARLAQQNHPVEKILSELESVRKRLCSSFVISRTDVMARRGNIRPIMNNLLNALWLRPLIRMKNDRMSIGRILFGNKQSCFAQYIRKELSGKVHPETGFVFVSYVGISEEELLWIEEMIQKRVHFDHIIFQKASAGIASHCGGGTFGIMYLEQGERSYNLGTLFAKLSEEEALYEKLLAEEERAEEDTADQTDTPSDANALTAEKEPEAAPKKWYETLPGIDASAALRNSGSEDAFLSVLKIYHDSFDVRYNELQNYYETEDWENYTIKVHALKSGSRLVGAMQLGDDAEALEMAGKSGDLDYIHSHHGEAMAEFRAIRDALAPTYGAKEALPEIPEATLLDAYAGLAEFAQAGEYNLAKMVLDTVKEYHLPEADQKRFEQIQSLLSQMDWNGILAVLDTVSA